MNTPVENVAGKGAAGKKPAVNETKFEPEDLELKNSAENNFLLGDLIE